MKYVSLLVLFLFINCGNKEDILLPKSNVTIIKEVTDHSPIYIFFRTKGSDTIAEVNRKNEIISTNWLFNIDKRLPLRLVIPEVIKLQEKKRNDTAHKNEAAQNYYSYADSIGKNLAFLPFTEVYYKMEKPRFGTIIYFSKDGKISVDNKIVDRASLQKYLYELPSDKPNKYLFCYSGNLPFGNYLQDKIMLRQLKFPVPELNLVKEEYIY